MAARPWKSAPATSSGSPPDERHWHGASHNTAMSHIAIQEKRDGVAVTWLEHVTDAQYLSTQKD